MHRCPLDECLRFVPYLFCFCVAGPQSRKVYSMHLDRQVKLAEPPMDALVWIGHTGRHYRLLPESRTGFQLSEGAVHVLIAGSEALWSGSVEDIVADPQSRARFRAAMAGEVSVYRIEPPPESDRRAVVGWDILSGHPAESLLKAC